MIKVLFLAATLTGTASGAAYAQTSPAPMTAGQAALDFITSASQSDMFEIQEGKMAQTIGSPVVRRFGTRSVNDHMEASANFHATIFKSGMAVPPPAPAIRPDQQKQMIGQFQGMLGLSAM